MTRDEELKMLRAELRKQGLSVDDLGEVFPTFRMGTEFSTVAWGIWVSSSAVVLFMPAARGIALPLSLISSFYLVFYYRRVFKDDRKWKAVLEENRARVARLRELL